MDEPKEPFLLAGNEEPQARPDPVQPSKHVTERLFADLGRRADRRGRGLPMGAPTGFTKLDEALGGGLGPGWIHVMAGAPGSGKSALALSIAGNISKNREIGKDGKPIPGTGGRVVYLTLELSPVACGVRALSAHTERRRLGWQMAHGTGSPVPPEFKAYPVGSLQRGVFEPDFATFEHWHGDAYSEIMQGVHFIDATVATGLTLDELREAVYQHLTPDGPNVDACNSLLIVDYLQLAARSLSESGSRSDFRQVVADFSQWLVSVARGDGEHRPAIPVLALSSTARENYKDERATEDGGRSGAKAPSLGMFKEAGDIESDADVCLGLHYPNEADSRSHHGRQIEVHVLKNRHGKAGDQVRLRYNPRYQLFLNDDDPLLSVGESSERAQAEVRY